MMKTNSGIANFVGLLICGILPQVLSITTTHHDKPPETKLSVMASKLQLKELQLNVTLPPGERQKRLLPYVNFYAQHSFNYPNRQAYINPQRYQLITPNPTSFQTFQHKFNELTGNNFQPKLVVDYRRVLQQPKIKLTPFTDTNALPGPFVPMRTAPQSVNYATIQQIGELPNYAAIYEKLSQLKLSQQGGQAGTAAYNQSPRYEAPQFIVNYVRKPQINYIPIREFQQDASGYKPPEQPTKTIIQTYTPTHVDVSPPFEPSSQLNPAKSYNEQHDTTPNAIRVLGTPVTTANNVQGRKQEITSTAGKPHQQTFKDEQQKIFEQQLKIYDDNQRIFVNGQKLQSGNPKQHVILHKVTPPIDQTYQLVPISNYNNVQKPKYETPQVQQNLVTVQKVDPIREYETVEKIEPENNFATETYERLPLVNVYQSNVNNQPIQTFQGITTTTPDIHKVQTEMYDENLQAPISGYQVVGTTENTNSLAEILKNLQESNHLPQNLTPENIDNSIKTLVRILNVLKKQQRLSKKPIIVAEQQSDEQESEVDNETGVGLGGYDEDTITEIFPADTPEGGTPGKPGIDYPALSTIPRTSFDCKTQRYKGFFGDPDTNCQVWHYCDFNGGQASFLCPNGTIFSQVALTCDWWYNVKCSTTPQLYVLNERLYKYILPYSPKFPEDYSGPLVDRYLAMKFQEMEEKMKKQRKKSKDDKDKSKNETEDVDDADELQLQNEENRKNSKERNDSEEQ